MTETTREIEFYTRKLIKAESHLKFLNNCREAEILPKFTRIPQKTTQRLLLQPQNARKIQHNIFNASYETHVTNINNYQHKLNTLFYILLQRNSNANKIFSIIKSRLKLTESFND